MRKRDLTFAFFFLFLLAGLPIPGERGFVGKAQEQDQPETPKFYARRVVFEKDVRNAKDSLGPPDGIYAEILPGGQLIVLMEKKIYPLAGLDSGLVISKGEVDYALEGWFPRQGTQDRQQYIWMPLFMGHSPGSFRLSMLEELGNSLGTEMIRIANSGSESLFVDAVFGFSREGEPAVAGRKLSKIL